jgi:hypothetical protein
MTFVPYVTPLASVVVPRPVKLGAIWITQTPLLDPAGPGLAHVMPVGAAEVARRHGGRMPTAADVLALHEAASAASTELAPIVLPTSAMRAHGCVPGDPRMVTREWCDDHDPLVIMGIRALGELGDNPVAGAGKHWTDPLGSLCGWWVTDVHAWDPSRHGPGFIQQGGHVVHGPGVVVGDTQEGGHSDYATTSVIVWDVDPATLELPQAA